MKKLFNFARVLSRKKISRRNFTKVCLSGILAIAMGSFLSRLVLAKSPQSTGRKKSNIKGHYDLVLAEGEDPYRMTAEAIKAMGGMSGFVKKGDVVVVKPNMSWDRAPEYATSTHPLVVACLVKLCLEAGASRVNVFDRTCNAKERCYENTQVSKAAEDAGAKVYYVDDWNFVKAKFNYSSPMEGWSIFRDAVECDVFINAPVLKHHGLTNLTLSMKNLMGVCGDNRGLIHNNIGRKLVDITDFISPDLTVIDAYRVLTRNGPSGGSLSDVKLMKKLIVATDSTLADTYACKLMGQAPESVPYIAEAIKRNFGNSDINSASIKKLSV